MTSTTFAVHRYSRLQIWPRWVFDLMLAVLFFGPLISPLFRATELPLVADAGWLARDLLSRFVCPTPERSYLLFGLPMAVCARCWGATIGLLSARWLVGRWSGSVQPAIARAFLQLPWALRLVLCALPFLIWPLEIVGHYNGWWYAPLWLLLINGAQAGFAAGLFFCSVWPGLWQPIPAVRGA